MTRNIAAWQARQPIALFTATVENTSGTSPALASEVAFLAFTPSVTGPHEIVESVGNIIGSGTLGVGLSAMTTMPVDGTPLTLAGPNTNGNRLPPNTERVTTFTLTAGVQYYLTIYSGGLQIAEDYMIKSITAV